VADKKRQKFTSTQHYEVAPADIFYEKYNESVNMFIFYYLLMFLLLMFLV